MLPLVKTKRQANLKNFKRFEAFKGLVEQKNVVYQINYYFLHIVMKVALFYTKNPSESSNFLHEKSW
jgi:hypothetical protein